MSPDLKLTNLSKLTILSGRTVLITRPQAQSQSLEALLCHEGATVEFQPAIEILPLEDYQPVDQAIQKLDQFDVIVFSSTNGVDFFLDRLTQQGLLVAGEPSVFRHVAVAAIGSSTAGELQSRGVPVDVVPELFRAEGLAEAIIQYFDRTQTCPADCQPCRTARCNGPVRVLLIRASRGREVLAEKLATAGMDVEQVVVYRSVDVTSPRPEIVQKLDRGEVDWVTMTSSAIAISTINLLGDRLKQVKIAAISPLTAEQIRSRGFDVHAVADPYTMEGLVQAVIDAENPAFENSTAENTA